MPNSTSTELQEYIETVKAREQQEAIEVSWTIHKIRDCHKCEQYSYHSVYNIIIINNN